MMLITPSYKELLEQDHEANPSWGTTGARYTDVIQKLCVEHHTLDVLDYGAGKGTLAESLGFPVKEYDPGVSGKQDLPESTDIVVSTDALEHVEPRCIRSVLNHLRELTLVRGFHAISTCKAAHHLPDGRNAHLLIQGADWWRTAFEMADFEVEELRLDCNKPRYAEICYTVLVK